MAAADFQHSNEWRQVVAMYGRPGVAQACLLLQDRLDVDVLVMLHLGHVCHQHRIALHESHVASADAVVRNWRDQVVRPLRSARRAIDKDDTDTQALRTAVQQAELGAEQHALAMLAALPVWTDTSPIECPTSTTELVAAFYAERGGHKADLKTAEIQAAIELLDRAWAADSA